MRVLQLFLSLILTATCFGQYLKPIRGMPFVNRTHPLGRSLVGSWLFNEGSGNTVFDLSGTSDPYASKNLPFLGDTIWDSGKFGSALSFDGTGDCVGRNVTNFLSLPDERSFLCWVKTSTVNTGILGRYSNAGWYQYRFFTNSSGYPYADIRQSNSADYATVNDTVAITDGNWHFLAATYDKQNLRLYIDGVEKDSAAGTFSTPTANFGFFIGANSHDGVAGTFLNGLIDHATIFNRALSASEIALLFREPFIMMKQPNPLLYTGVVGVPPPPSGQFIMIIMSSIPLFLIPFFIIRRNLVKRN